MSIRFGWDVLTSCRLAAGNINTQQQIREHLRHHLAPSETKKYDEEFHAPAANTLPNGHVNNTNFTFTSTPNTFFST